MEKCPCSSNKNYMDCCGRFIEGAANATTAEELMRSRYTAHVKVKVDYIMATVHASNRLKNEQKKIEKWAKETDWQRLKVIRTEKGSANDSEGRVSFIAYYKEGNDLKKHGEDASFIKEDGKWFYVAGKTLTLKGEQKIAVTKKISRNDPCPCGSGKKYKKCCAKL